MADSGALSCLGLAPHLIHAPFGLLGSYCEQIECNLVGVSNSNLPNICLYQGAWEASQLSLSHPILPGTL